MRGVGKIVERQLTSYLHRVAGPAQTLCLLGEVLLV